MYRVLIVEDEDIIRNGLKYSVDWSSYNCIVSGEATNGLEAIQMLEEINPQIILLDINMPLKNGLEFLKETYSNAQFSTIIISGYSDFSKAKEAIKYNVTEYLLKPVDHHELGQALVKAQNSYDKKNQYNLLGDKMSDLERKDLVELVKMETIKSSEIYYLLSEIEEKYAEKLTIQAYTDVLDWSKSYLNQKFKEEVGYTFNDYLNRYRIYMAIKLLEKGTEKIYNIALDVGYSNYRYFIEVFKKYTKILPTEYIDYYNNQYLK